MTEINRPISLAMLVKKCGQIVVPQIQRDYAQGRETEKEVRESFLAALHAALTTPVEKSSVPLNLDFIYGSMEGKADRSFLPLDGQQRLTTLFLLHWYLAWRDDQLSKFKGLFWNGKHSRFSYAVRPSSKEFFDELVQYDPRCNPDTVTSLKRLIEDQPWFFLYWRLDPTIQSVLIMLDALHTRFRATTGVYATLVTDERPAITFQLLQLEHFGLSDDLYIKMNARGKPLTAFETFKARFEEDVKRLFPSEQRKLGATQVGVPQFLAVRMDTRWTDFFWIFKDPTSHTFDAAAMNLLWALARISLDPEAPSFADDTALLRSKHAEATYTIFHERGWLTREFVASLICLLEAWSSGAEKLTAQLPNGRYFDELNFLQKAIKTPETLDYTEIVQFAAFVSYLKQNEGCIDSIEFQEWARVVFNLSVNSTIERPDELGRALAGIETLLPHSREILSYLAATDIPPNGFSQQAMREEIVKAKLILSHRGWRERIDIAEQHGYFRGQIDFLLDFSGILAQSTQPVSGWSQDLHAALQGRFDDYLKKARATFGDHGLKVIHGPSHLWRRALLTIGDYLPSLGINSSFLTDPPTYWNSWKRFLRGNANGKSPTRRHLKTLWDRLVVNMDFASQLGSVIAEASDMEPWRMAVVRTPAAIDYGESREIRKSKDLNTIYLLKKTQMNGAHAELFSYALHHELTDPAVAATLRPLKLHEYQSVSGIEIEPYVLMSCSLPKCDFFLTIESTDGQFQISAFAFKGKNSSQTTGILRSELGFTGSDQRVSRRASRGDVREVIQSIAKALATISVDGDV